MLKHAIMEEQEVIFHEIGPHEQRSYIKPTGQTNTVVTVSKSYSVLNAITAVFLPQGYPESVSKDYMAYQIWDTTQALCSTIAGILATQEVLRGLGVGDINATPLAATITWVLKDGCGHIGRILFAFTHGIYMDAYSKKWRLLADILNDAAMCIEMALPIFGVYSLIALCISTTMKAIVGIAGGATRVAMTQHHAIIGNLADVSAKDSAQETAVNLVASFASLLIISCFGGSLFIFVSMLFLHIAFNYLAVRAVCLRTLNDPRFLLLIDEFLMHGTVSTPDEVNRKEPIDYLTIGPSTLDLKMCGFKITVGASIMDAFTGEMNPKHLERLRDVYAAAPYMLAANNERRSVHVYLKQGATADDVLHAYFHAVQLALVTRAINDKYLAMRSLRDPPPFAMMLIMVHSVPWSRQEACPGSKKCGYNPSAHLHRYLNKIVATQWATLRDALEATGWDVTKHLLVTDQWRMSKEETITGSGDVHDNITSVISNRSQRQHRRRQAES